MSKRGVGLLLILTAAIALGALVQDFRFDRLIAAEQSAVSGFEQRLQTLEQAIDTLSASRRSALASGEMPSDWLNRVSSSIADVEAALTRERSAVADAPTIAAFDAATTALSEFKRADSTGVVQGIHDGLASARAANRRRADTTLRQIAQLRLGMNAIAVLFTLGVAIYLGRAATVPGYQTPPTTAQMVRDLPPAVKPGPTVLGVSPSATTVAHPPAPTTPHRPSANLAAAAELCVDLAKVMDADAVPALLERAALVLDARGIVVWAIDTDGARLRPSLSYGYSDRVLAKLRPLQIDADNVTSLAFRSVQPQMMNGALTTDAAALAIPLLTGGGCVGVLAVELRHNRPHADLLPVARILGAQFSTLITPTEELARMAAKG